MKLNEYKKVENLNYIEYCDYLQDKYGIGLCDYMRPNWTKNPKITRTKEGLYAHHKYENCAIMLSHPEYAKKPLRFLSFREYSLWFREPARTTQCLPLLKAIWKWQPIKGSRHWLWPEQLPWDCSLWVR